MKNQNVCFLLIFLFFTKLSGQNLSVTDLTNLCKNPNWESANRYLLTKGWEYYDSKKGDSEKTDIILWSFAKETINDQAQGWINLYLSEGSPCKISYKFYNKSSYNKIQNSIETSGFKLQNSEINDNLIVTSYTGISYILKVAYEKVKDDNWENRSLTAYDVTLIKKNGIFDSENGNKTDYFENGQIKSQYTLKDSKVNGKINTYHENGKLQKTGYYVDGKANGNFTEYDDQGEKTVEYFMVNDEINGTGSVFKNNRLSQIIEYKNGIVDGKYTELLYNDYNKLYLKIVGKYKAGLKADRWETRSINDGKEEIIEIKNYSNDIRNGEFMEYVSSDSLIITNYTNGLLNGHYILKIKTTGTIGKSNDPFSFWNKSCEGNYKNGLKDGKWEYSIMGMLSEVGNFQNDKRQGIWTKYVFMGDKAGEILTQTEFLNNKKNGIETTFYSTIGEEDTTGGQSIYKFKNTPILETTIYKNDQKNGEYILKDSTGHIQVSGHFINDLKEETWKYYNQNGTLSEEKDYSNDKIQTAKYFDNSNELLLVEKYSNNKLDECDYYSNSILSEKHKIEYINNGNKITTLEGISNKNDTVISSTYLLYTDEPYTYNLLLKKGIKEGPFSIFVKNNLKIKGEFNQNKKNGSWILYYPEADVYATRTFRQDSLDNELFYENSTKAVISGTIEILENDKKIKIKLKKGLRNGKTTYYKIDGTKIYDEVFIDGQKK